MTESPATALQSPYPDMAQEKLYSACMQERVTTSCKEQDTMEPDSSTDSQEQSHGLGQAYDGGGGGGDVVEEEEEAEDEDEDEENGVDERKSDRMQKLLAEHARMFNPKLEPESKRPKPYKSPQEELAELMKLTNEKLFKSSNQNRSLPLSVEIDEQDSSCDSVSPPRNPYMVTNSLSPRKRGRKPKHYSEILYELGQRGISITKTSKPSPLPASTEMVVSENGAVSHKASGQQLKCPHCNKILTTSVGLMYHIRLHTGEKPYSCDICGKSFATSSHYHYHIRSHSGEKPYRCDFCGKMYTASGSLRLHLKSHLSRLAANAFNTINLPGFPPSQNGAGGLQGMSQDSLQMGSNDLKIGIKQEVFEISENLDNGQTGESSNKSKENPNNIGLNNIDTENE